MLKKGHTIVFSPNTNPINLARFEPQTYTEKSKIPPPRRRVLKVDDSLVSQCLQTRDDQIITDSFLNAAAATHTAPPLEGTTNGGDALATTRDERPSPRTNAQESKTAQQTPSARTADRSVDTTESPKRDRPFFNEFGDRIPRI